jgi:Fe2+ or Zn2+ uptake regulation protein
MPEMGDLEASTELGFATRAQTLEVHGICARCAERERAAART